MNKIRVQVVQNGDAVVSDEGYLPVKGDKVVAFYLDAWGETGRAYPEVYSLAEVNGVSSVPSIIISDGRDDSKFSEVCFPDFPGYRVHCADGGKTMSICLVRW